MRDTPPNEPEGNFTTENADLRAALQELVGEVRELRSRNAQLPLYDSLSTANS